MNIFHFLGYLSLAKTVNIQSLRGGFHFPATITTCSEKAGTCAVNKQINDKSEKPPLA